MEFLERRRRKGRNVNLAEQHAERGGFFSLSRSGAVEWYNKVCDRCLVSLSEISSTQFRRWNSENFVTGDDGSRRRCNRAFSCIFAYILGNLEFERSFKRTTRYGFDTVVVILWYF